MFTGIIESMAKILQCDQQSITLVRPPMFDDVRLGSSISVSGVCLTIVRTDSASLSFDVVPETFSRSTLGTLKPGDRVNLERAMRADGRFDGHVVQGHVEGAGKVLEIVHNPASILVLTVPGDLLPFIIPKGSITLDGVSLTVASIEGDRLTVALIPETLERTTLGHLQTGDRVNIESDIFIRAVLHQRKE